MNMLRSMINRLKRAERKLEKELHPIRAAITAMETGSGSRRRIVHRHKRVLSASAISKMSLAAKKRWRVHRTKLKVMKSKVA